MWVLAGFALCGLLIKCGQLLEKWLHTASEETARKVFALVVIPTITASIMGLIAFGSTQYLCLAAQLIIIPVAALLPAVTYYLFLTTRRPSILNEFIANLGRLGLTGSQRRAGRSPARLGRRESDAERSARVRKLLSALRVDLRGVAIRIQHQPVHAE